MRLVDFLLFEDADLLLVNKPPNLVVNRAETQKEKTLQDYLEEYLPIKNSGIGGRAGIVHRLDRETSGLIVVAKNLAAYENLQQAFKKHEVEKKYLALVHGQPRVGEGIIDAPLGRNPKNRLKFAVVAGKRPAVTQFKSLGLYQRDREQTFSLLEVSPKTGRTHQVRVHLVAFGHPIVADPLYAGRKRSRQDREWCPRLFLHASTLRFRHPVTGEALTFSSTLPADLRAVLRKLTRLENR